LQLEIVMHLANGRTLNEIAKTLDRSRSHIGQQADRARRKAQARTLPQLVSIVIASGQLEWQDNQRVLNGATPPA
jgi:DNA-binding CsgD family transcriptional regulator